MKIVKDFLHEVKHRISHEKTTENFLGAFIEYTNKWKILSNWLTKIFSYLDRFYLPEKKIKNLSWQCMNLYRSIVKFIFTRIDPKCPESRFVFCSE